MSRPALLLFTSLYPYPWQPSRATFNFQQYQALEQHRSVEYLVPVPFYLWLRHLPLGRRRGSYARVCYFPFFYVPGLLRSLNGLFLLLSTLISIVPAWKLLRARTVLASWAVPDALAVAGLKPLLRYRLFIQCLGSDVNVFQESPLHRRMLAVAFGRANGVVTVSEDLARKVRSIQPSARVSTIYNGVNFQRFALAASPHTSRNLIFIGNLIITKGIHELLEALPLLEATSVTLDVVGGGPEAAALAAKTKTLGLEEQVHFHGRLPHDEVAALVRDSRALVLPSYTEGIPNVIMEALACGIPVVATRVGGIPEVLNDKNGVLLEDHTPRSIADGINRVLDQSWEPATLRASINHLTWEANSLQLHNLLDSDRPNCHVPGGTGT